MLIGNLSFLLSINCLQIQMHSPHMHFPSPQIRPHKRTSTNADAASLKVYADQPEVARREVRPM